MLYHFDSTADATGKHAAIQMTNTANISTAQSKFGPSSLNIPAASSAATAISGLSVVGSAGYVYFTDDFTIEMFFYTTGSTNRQTLFKGRTATFMWCLITPSTGRIELYLYGASPGPGTPTTIADINVDPSAIPLNTWNYFAIKRVGSTMSVWMNGVQVASNPSASGQIGYSLSDVRVDIGSAEDYATNLKGYVDEFCLTRGFAKDVSTVPTSPLLVY